MKTRIRLLFILIYIFLLGNGTAFSNDNNRIEITDKDSAHPVLIYIEIPSAGYLEKNVGRAYVLEYETGKYIEIKQDIRINDGSIVRLHQDSIINLHFDDGSLLTLGPTKETKWFKFSRMIGGT